MKTFILIATLAISTSCANTPSVLTEDQAFELILLLPDNVWESISLKCGDSASYTDMYNEYLSNKDKYDSLDYSIIDTTL